MGDERFVLLIEDNDDVQLTLRALKQHRVPNRVEAACDGLATSYDRGADSSIRKPVDFTQSMQAVDSLGLYWLVLNESPPPTES